MRHDDQGDERRGCGLCGKILRPYDAISVALNAIVEHTIEVVGGPLADGRLGSQASSQPAPAVPAPNSFSISRRLSFLLFMEVSSSLNVVKKRLKIGYVYLIFLRRGSAVQRSHRGDHV